MAVYAGVTASYTPIEYLESNGTQYIDTGFYANQDTRIEAKARTVGISSGEGWQCLFSSKTAFLVNGYVVQINNSTAKWYAEYGSYNEASILSVSDNTDYTIDMNKNIVTVNGTTATITAGTFQSTQPGTIFTDWENNAPTHYWRGRLYYMKIYDDGTLVRDYIPVKDEDGVGCLLDKVQNKVYYNQGTGTFNLGNETGEPTIVVTDKARLAKKLNVGVNISYALVDYIKNVGHSCIDTGFKPNQNTRVECQIMLENIRTDGDYDAVFSGRDSYHSAGFTIFAGNGKWFNEFGNTSNEMNASAINPQCGTLYTIDKNKNVTTINGTSSTLTNSTFQSNHTIKIFSEQNGGSTADLMFRLYYFKIYDNGALVRDFYPAVDNRGVGCLYEAVDDTLYYNANGNDLEPSLFNTDEYEVLDYIEGTGTQYINTGFKHNQDTKIIADIDYLTQSNPFTQPFGAWGGDNPKKMMGCEYYTSSNSLNTFYGNMAQYSFGNTVGRKTYVFNKNVYKIGSTSHTFSSATFQSEYNDGVFAASNYEGGFPADTAKMKLYSCKIFDNGTLVRDYVPVKKKANNEACLLERVSGTLYTNQGTGDFVAGNVIGSDAPTTFTDLGVRTRKIKRGFVGVLKKIYTS